MNIYLIRHGEAESISSAKSDFDRNLTPAGKELIKTASEGWKKIIPSFNIIASSPLTRAVQTAEIISTVFGLKEKILVDKRLTSGGKPEDIIDFIKSVKGEDIAIVGHEPDLSRSLSAMVSSNGMYTGFSRGSIAKINFGGKIRLSGGLLEFLIPLDVFI